MFLLERNVSLDQLLPRRAPRSAGRKVDFGGVLLSACMHAPMLTTLLVMSEGAAAAAVAAAPAGNAAGATQGDAGLDPFTAAHTAASVYQGEPIPPSGGNHLLLRDQRIVGGVWRALTQHHDMF